MNLCVYCRYDALTGVPSIQRTVAFEKASVLFNLAALHTQIGSKQDRQTSSDTADAAVDNFLRAAGTLRYIGEHFTHPPSFDLAPHTLDALTSLFLVSLLYYYLLCNYLYFQLGLTIMRTLIMFR